MTTVFISYSHRDEEYRNELETHLAMLKREHVIDVWHDRRIVAGEDIDVEIDGNLTTADIVLLLVSPYFLDSDYCYDVEMSNSIDRHNLGEAVVIPVIVHPCDWHNAPFGRLKATPTDGKPISKFPNIHDAYLNVVKDIRESVGKLNNGNKNSENSTDIEPEKDVVTEHPRSSNLRLKKDFTDKEKDDFLESSFEYISNFFENSMQELQVRNSNIETKFKRIDKTHFTAAIYSNGNKISFCKIWQAGINSYPGGIGYSTQESGGDNSYNESLSVVEDGYSLFLRPMGLAFSSFGDGEGLTKQGGAEHLWSIFLGPLQ